MLTNKIFWIIPACLLLLESARSEIYFLACLLEPSYLYRPAHVLGRKPMQFGFNIDSKFERQNFSAVNKTERKRDYLSTKNELISVFMNIFRPNLLLLLLTPEPPTATDGLMALIMELV